MRSEAEIREATAQVMRVAERAWHMKDSDTVHRLAALRGVLNWVMQEDSGFGELLETWRNIELREAQRQ